MFFRRIDTLSFRCKYECPYEPASKDKHEKNGDSDFDTQLFSLLFICLCDYNDGRLLCNRPFFLILNWRLILVWQCWAHEYLFAQVHYHVWISSCTLMLDQRVVIYLIKSCRLVQFLAFTARWRAESLMGWSCEALTLMVFVSLALNT